MVDGEEPADKDDVVVIVIEGVSEGVMVAVVDTVSEDVALGVGVGVSCNRRDK